MRDGQASSEYVILIAAVLLVTLSAIYILQSSTSGVNEVKISESRNYWRSASPLRMDDWAVKSSVPDANGAAAQLAMVIANPTQEMIVLKKILITGYNFTETYSRGANYAGEPGNLAPITFAPGETNTIVVIQTEGPQVPDGYEIWLDFDMLDNNVQKTQEGVVPLRGRTDLVTRTQASIPPGAGCSVGQILCNTTGTVVCCGSGQVCSQGVTCCAMGQVACSGSCCAGSCFNGVCIPPGSNYCNWTGAECQIPNNCCSTGCISGPCPSPDYVILSITSNSTSLANGESANVTFITKNNGTLDATGSSYTRITIGTWASGVAVAPLLVDGEQEDSVEYACNGLLSGWHSVVVMADANSEVSEFNESNNGATYVLQIYCAPATGPDMAVIDVFPADTSLTMGESANITANTTNVGGTTSGIDTTTNINLVTGGVPSSFTSLNVPVLASGAWNAQNFTFECNQSTVGTHVINATADYANAVNEGANENNNFHDSATIECTGPDLVVPLLATAPNSLLLGEHSIIQFTVKNNGTADAPATNASLNATGGSGNPISDTLFSIISLTPGLSQKKVSLFTCNESFIGEWNVTAYADNTSDVFETNETNNQNSMIVNCTAMDLEVVSVQMNSANPIGSGGTTRVDVQFQNIGASGSGYWLVYPIVNSSPTGILISSSPYANVSQNGTVETGKFNVTCPDDLQVDTNYVVNVSVGLVSGDINDANNWRAVTVQCLHADPTADLAIGPLEPGSTSINQNGQYVLGSSQTTNISFDMGNIGIPKSGTWSVVPVASATDPWGGPSGTFDPMPTIVVPKDGSMIKGHINYTCPNNLAQNTSMSITVNLPQVNDETETANNEASIDIICLMPAPDITIEPVWSTPASPINVSDYTNIEFNTSNIGDMDVTLPIDVDIVASGGTLNGPQFVGTSSFTLTTSPLNAYDSQTATPFSYYCPSTEGTYTITMDVVPPTGEINTFNNHNEINITCNGLTSPDIDVLMPTFNRPSPILVNENTTMTVMVRNVGNGATGTFTVYMNATNGTVNQTSFNIAGLDAQSATFVYQFKYTCPSYPGTFYITINASTVAGETNDENNVKVAQFTCNLGPDIMVHNLSAVDNPIYTGQSTTVRIPVSNVGPGPSQSFVLSSASNGTLSNQYLSVSALSAYSSIVWVTETFTCPATPGNYTVNATAPQLYAETNIANNFNQTTIECLPPQADLYISNGWVTRSSTFFQVVGDWVPTEVGYNINYITSGFIPYGHEFWFTYMTCNGGQLATTVPTITSRIVSELEPVDRDTPPDASLFNINPAQMDIVIPPLAPDACGGAIARDSAYCPYQDAKFELRIYPDNTDLVDESAEKVNDFDRHEWYCRSPPDLEIGDMYAKRINPNWPYDWIASNTLSVGNISRIYAPYTNIGFFGIFNENITIQMAATSGLINNIGVNTSVICGSTSSSTIYCLPDAHEGYAEFICTEPGWVTIQAVIPQVGVNPLLWGIPETNTLNNAGTLSVQCV